MLNRVAKSLVISVLATTVGFYAPVVAPATCAEQARFVFIVPDEGQADPTFMAFRKQLIAAVQNRDRAFIESILSPNVLTALGGVTGKKSFLEQWPLTADSPFWQKMQRVLAHGAQYDRDSKEFHAPALSFSDSHIDLPQGIVWNKGAQIHKEADASSLVLRTLYAEQLTITQPPDPSPITKKWIKVVARDGATGFMQAADIYSQYDEFATFKQEHQKWCLTWFGFAGL